MKSGIYIIKCYKNPEKYYVGSTSDFYKRWKCHKHRLKHNKHGCNHLQNVYNKYGKETFQFYILEEIKDLSQLLDREDYYLQDFFWFDDELYNECFIAGNILGSKRGPCSEETKKKLVKPI